MVFKKILFTGLFTISLSSLSLFAHAAQSLTIDNHTNQDSTAIINNGACSANVLGESGITRAGKSNTISDFVVWYACYASPHDCKADVYMTANCSGNKIATVMFDTSTGIKSVTMLSDAYSFNGTGFNITLNNGTPSL